MTTHTLLVFALALGVLQPAAIAQYVDNQEQRSGNTAPARPDEPRPLLTNVQVELTITDSMPSASPQKRRCRWSSSMVGWGASGRRASTAQPC
jgi:hypothetical protein